MRRWLATTALVAVTLLGAPAPAEAKSFSLPQAVVEITVKPNGVVQVTEHLTYLFDGTFSGGYREIPLEQGETITDIRVAEGDVAYEPGAPAELGSSAPPRTFGVAELDGRTRIVWHYRATNEARTFSISYRFRNLAVAYDDVVDVALQVWGDEWASRLGSLQVNVSLPGLVLGSEGSNVSPGEILVWGHPSEVSGMTLLTPQGAALTASDIPPHQFVEMRVVFPRRLLSSTTGANEESGEGLRQIAAEESTIAREDARALERQAWTRENFPLLAFAGFLLAFLPGLWVCLLIWTRFGKEPPAPEVPRHIHEPPGDEAPAVIAALLATGNTRTTGDAFTATLFDLIRRGFIDASATTSYKKTWGGLKEDEVSDIAVKLTSKDPDLLAPFERDVWRAVEHAQGERESFLLSEMKGDITTHPEFYSKRFKSFKERVKTELSIRGWWHSEGRRVTVVAWIIALVLTAACLFMAAATVDPVNEYAGATLGWMFAAYVTGAALIMFTVFARARRGWERRSQEGAEKAAYWTAFKRFLQEFEGIPDAAPGSIVIWEQYLCYGIAFGVADRVLAAAELHAPEELQQTSSVFWVSPGGHLGAGSSAFAISDISGAVAAAAPPASSGGFSGGGGGFSGGGGGFSGGGGGGAW